MEEEKRNNILDEELDENFFLDSKEEKGSIKKNKLEIKQILDNKKIFLVLIIVVLVIGLSLILAGNKSKENKNATETVNLSSGSVNDLSESISEYQRSNEENGENLEDNTLENNEENENSKDDLSELSDYDDELGGSYKSSKIDFDDTEEKNSDTPIEEKKEPKQKRELLSKNNKNSSSETRSTENYQSNSSSGEQNDNQQNYVYDQNKQREKEEFLKKKHNGFYQTNGIVPRISKYELKMGSLIPSILLTEINSDLPGEIIAQVRENVFDSVDGKYLLIPMGTRIIGTYDSNVTYGQNRVLLIWQRLIFPNGESLELENFKGVDLLGRAGIKARTNNHFFELLRSIVLSSAIEIATGTLKDVNVNVNAGDRARVSLGSGAETAGEKINDIGSRLVEKDLNRQPTLHIKSGKRFSIAVSKDIVLKPYKKGRK